MIHPLDPGAPLKHANGFEYSEAERLKFFQDVEKTVRNYYRGHRVNHYAQMLTVGDQLDMLWHELNKTGTISKEGEWFKAVCAVKAKHPNDDSEYQRAVEQVAQLRKSIQEK